MNISYLCSMYDKMFHKSKIIKILRLILIFIFKFTTLYLSIEIDTYGNRRFLIEIQEQNENNFYIG